MRGPRMKSLVLDSPRVLALRDMDFDETLGPRDVRIVMHTVGICGSDLHYDTDGRVGPFVVSEPLVLGHEGSGPSWRSEVKSPPSSPATASAWSPHPPTGRAAPLASASTTSTPQSSSGRRLRCTAACVESVVHPASLTYLLPDKVSYAVGALIEPLAVGMHAAKKARITPGDVAVVTGCGTIGIMTALAAIAGGCSRAMISDLVAPKLDLAATLGPITPVNIATDDLAKVTMDLTGGWGADIVFEASGSARAAASALDPLRPGGAIVFVGMPNEMVSFDIVALAAKEARIETVFRYANVYDRAIDLVASGRIDVAPLVTDTFPFDRAVEAFAFAADMPPTSVKVQIKVAP